jgi:hypothetical protein
VTTKEAMSAAVRAAKATKEETTLTTSRGIVFNLVAVPPLLLREAAANVKKPPVPTFYNEDRGITEENPSHPDYLEALEAYEKTTVDASLDLMVLAGTELETVPEGLSGPRDDGWRRALRLARVEVDWEDEDALYLAWVKFYALTKREDLDALTKALTRLSGISEEEVQAAAASFRRNSLGGGTDEVPASVNRDGAGVQEDPAVDSGRAGGA